MHSIRLRGATTHNLRGIDLDVEPGTLLVVTGPSGAGKSSLAFSTLYAEGQRRYVESFSAYARQFLERLARPPVDELDPVPAAVAVDRRASVKTSRSTVATMTELSDHVRQLWLHGAQLSCPDCGRAVKRESTATAAAAVLEHHDGERVLITYALSVEDAEHYLALRESLLTLGYRRIYLGGELRDLDSIRPSDALEEGELTVVVDRTTARSSERTRLVEALDVALLRGDEEARVVVVSDGQQLRFSRKLACDGCGRSFARPTQGLFSFNSPVGACEACRGFGRTMEVDWDRVIPDLTATLQEGGVKAWAGRSFVRERRALFRFCKQAGIAVDVPVGELSEEARAALLDGDGGSWRTGYPGLRRWFTWLETKSYKMHVRVFLARHRKYVPCEACGGTRFKREVLGFRLDGLTLPEFYGLSVSEARSRIERLDEHAAAGLDAVLRECGARLATLCDVGLSYLTLDRSIRTLSGGELQRVGLTSALSADLRGTLFVLDEPTSGLHPVDVERLFPSVRRLAESDNIVAVVESDPHFVVGADRVLELGPKAGVEGGRIVFDGTPAALKRARTATSLALWPRGRGAWTERTPRTPTAEITLLGARGHNLRGVDLRLPLGVLSCVTGVSGSGKSSLILDTLVAAVAQARGDARARPLAFDRLVGEQRVGQVVVVDQEPLSRSSRANPATYLGAWDAIRKQLSNTELAKQRDYGPGTFSFNVAGGRCEACKGEGSETVEMQFMADVTFSCPECGGRRFAGPVLDVKVGELDVSQLLELTVDEAIVHFAAVPKVVEPLARLRAIGAGYLRLGQPLSTLSGGEAQRLKLAAALAKVAPGDLFVLDEPTAGLHASDVSALIEVLHRLVDLGGTVVVIEHEMALAATADHVIDLGPGPGAQGGELVAEGAPADVAAAADSRTAPFLAAQLARKALAPAAARRRRSKTSGFSIEVLGAREHNLRGVDVRLPRGKLVVVTGPSGSGKSTLAFDVIFAEAQRRYTETLSPYVRQYLKLLPRPAVDQVHGMPPAVSLEQRTTSGATSSTVATVTEVAHYLRLAYARAGTLHCPDCDVPIAPRPAAALAEDLVARHGRRRVRVMAPLIRGRKGLHRDRLGRARRDGHTHARIDGEITELTPGLALDRYKEHDIELVFGELPARDAGMLELLSRALRGGDGVVLIGIGTHVEWLSDRRACASCGRGFPELDPRLFSFNTEQGGCPRCEGAGSVEPGGHRKGRKGRKGRKAKVQRVTCPECEGGRLGGLALHTYLDGRAIGELMGMDVRAVGALLSTLKLSGRAAQLAAAPVAEAVKRLAFLDEVGLGYLHLGRAATGLSGGELQRVRLAAQLGSGLTGLLYVLDEPTIGLHPRDTGKLLGALRRLVDTGCSVLVVEHDADSILAAEHMIDVGPGAGRKGGTIVAQGSPAELLADPKSVSGSALARPVAMPPRRSVRGPAWVEVTNARQHNLRGVRLRVPVGRLSVVCGVSGSGKSTLVREVFLRALRKKLDLVADPPGEHGEVKGHRLVRRAVEIDQTPIGRTPRSVPATYVGIWDELRKLYARTPEARARGYGPSRFSFNVAAGRCPVCDGQGATTMEMAFLPQALLPCEVCAGQRFNPETLDIRLYGLTVGQVLRMEVDEVAQTFAAIPKVAGPLALLSELGMGYLQLGQASNTLSGGEAQRLKLVSELNASGAGPTLYVMDEPTTGLHRDDVTRLLGVIDRLVDRGDTVVVIEHHTDVVAHADWVVELGPDGGAGGGKVVVEGTPEDVMAHATSHTGAALRAEVERVGTTALQRSTS